MEDVYTNQPFNQWTYQPLQSTFQQINMQTKSLIAKTYI